MQVTPSTTTLERSRESLEQFPDRSKDHDVQAFEEGYRGPLQAERRRGRFYRWTSAIWWGLESKYPRVTQQTRRFLLHMRGPRPVVDLPGSLSAVCDTQPNFVSRRAIPVDRHSDYSRADVRPAT